MPILRLALCSAAERRPRKGPMESAAQSSPWPASVQRRESQTTPRILQPRWVCGCARMLLRPPDDLLAGGEGGVAFDAQDLPDRSLVLCRAVCVLTARAMMHAPAPQAFVYHFTEALRSELAPLRIRVADISVVCVRARAHAGCVCVARVVACCCARWRLGMQPCVCEARHECDIVAWRDCFHIVAWRDSFQ